eukprot:TRINITY_DN2741_c0_g1_i2.p1 TRINITY_DN2741_c0_g1~~TRINITY_DN2741_c0_g1_i2.p1  ORF type:complete len:849 (+),score=214.37 TRINITY_DN2741_c0_g1_i2:148-2547(+)
MLGAAAGAWTAPAHVATLLGDRLELRKGLEQLEADSSPEGQYLVCIWGGHYHGVSSFANALGHGAQDTALLSGHEVHAGGSVSKWLKRKPELWVSGSEIAVGNRPVNLLACQSCPNLPNESMAAYRLMLRSCDAVVAVGDFDQEELARLELGAEESRAAVADCDVQNDTCVPPEDLPAPIVVVAQQRHQKELRAAPWAAAYISVGLQAGRFEQNQDLAKVQFGDLLSAYRKGVREVIAALQKNLGERPSESGAQRAGRLRQGAFAEFQGLESTTMPVAQGAITARWANAHAAKQIASDVNRGFKVALQSSLLRRDKTELARFGCYSDDLWQQAQGRALLDQPGVLSVPPPASDWDCLIKQVTTEWLPKRWQVDSRGSAAAEYEQLTSKVEALVQEFNREWSAQALGVIHAFREHSRKEWQGRYDKQDLPCNPVAREKLNSVVQGLFLGRIKLLRSWMQKGRSAEVRDELALTSDHLSEHVSGLARALADHHKEKLEALYKNGLPKAKAAYEAECPSEGDRAALPPAELAGACAKGKDRAKDIIMEELQQGHSSACWGDRGYLDKDTTGARILSNFGAMLNKMEAESIDANNKRIKAGCAASSALLFRELESEITAGLITSRCHLRAGNVPPDASKIGTITRDAAEKTKLQLAREWASRAGSVYDECYAQHSKEAARRAERYSDQCLEEIYSGPELGHWRTTTRKLVYHQIPDYMPTYVGFLPWPFGGMSMRANVRNFVRHKHPPPIDSGVHRDAIAERLVQEIADGDMPLGDLVTPYENAITAVLAILVAAAAVAAMQK